MADNTTFQTTLASPPSGLVVATDDVSSVHFQKIKIDVGADGVSAPLGNSNPIPVSDAGGSLTVDGTVTALLSASVLGGSPSTFQDFDTGGGTQNNSLIGIALPASGGAVIGGTFTNPLRTDPTGTTTQPVSDGGGSLTIDGAVTLGAALPAGTNNIGDVDILSVVPGTGATNLGKAEDAQHTSGDTGVMALGVRSDSGSAFGADGDYVPLSIDSSGALRVTGGGGGTQYTEDIASAADPVGNMLVGRRRDAPAAETTTDGDNIALNATNKGELYVKHIDTIPVTDNGGSITVDGAVTVSGTVAISAGTANIGDVDVLTVPAPLSTTGGGTEATALRVTLANDSTGLVSIDDNGGSITIDDGAGSITVDGTVTANLAAGNNNIGDVDIASLPAPLNVTGGGAEATALRVTIANDSTGVVSIDDNGASVTVDGTVTANLAAGTNNIGDVDVLTVPAPLNVTGNGAAATALRVTLANDSTGIVSGNVAHDSPVSGNPVTVAGEGRSSDYTAVANGDVARNLATLLGKQVTTPYALPGNTWNYAAASGGIVNTTGVTAKASAGGGIRNYVTAVQVINGHASQGTDVQIRDGASGTVLWRGWAQPGGGGAAANFDPPLRGTAATLIEVACGTSGAAVYFNLQGFVAGE